MDFIDRQDELSFLEEKWNAGEAQFLVLWGKRRVGKTELLKQFIKDKPHVYYLSENTNEKEQLLRLSHALGRYFEEPLLETRGFSSWEECFRYIEAKKSRFVLVIDEFPYLVYSNPGVTSLFQKAWDEYWKHGNVFLVLLGSSMAMMENEVLGYKSPLYGRRTGQWRVDPMPFNAVKLFRQGRSFEDRMAHYAVAGGIPAYWLHFNDERGFEDNLRNSVLKKGEVLYDEVEFILREELREPRYYFALLQAIAQGKRRLSEIVNATGLSQPVANKYLGVLADLKIVERELPVTEGKPLKSKKGLYQITDEFFRFWFRFVFPKRSDLEMGRIDEVSGSIARDLPQYLGGIYEKVAIQTLTVSQSELFPFSAIGRWWDRQDEIDIVAINKERDTILFGEVKWSEKPLGNDIYEGLKKKAEKVLWGSKNRKELFCLVSRSGFTSSLLKKAHEELVLIRKDDLALR
jgi:AAA+ ATPase superfamily predicted ATPase